MATLSDQQRIALSKHMARILRHRAGDSGLSLNSEGFVPLGDLLAAIRRVHGWEWVRVAQIEEVIARQEKRRYEIVEGNIRAIYGHSLATAVSYRQVVPPDVLLHGTARRFVEAIRSEGLRPMRRQYVHLTDDPALALRTGRRRDAQPAILRIDAARAHAAGVIFFRADDGVYLAKSVPPEFLL